MTFPKKGSRRITVNDNIFVWTVGKKPTHNERHNETYKIPVQHINGGQLLLIDLDYTRSGYVSDSTPAVTPCIMEQCILKAMDEGWDFLETKGNSFHLDCSDIMFRTTTELVNRFINRLEEVNKKEQNEYLENIIAAAKEMIHYGEYKIALENSVSNLCEYNITLDKDIVQIAYNVFAIYKDDSYKRTLEALAK